MPLPQREPTAPSGPETGQPHAWEVRVQRCLGFTGRAEVALLARVALSPARTIPKRHARTGVDPRQLALDWAPRARVVIGAPRKCSPLSRPRTIPGSPLNRREREDAQVLAFLEPNWDKQRPSTRADCEDGGKNSARPCPWVSCRHHLAITVSEETGAIKVVFPDPEGLPDWDAMPETCSLDVAERVRHEGQNLTIQELGRLQNMSLERVDQLSARAYQEVLVKIRRVTR